MAEKLKTFDEVIGQKNIIKWFKSCIQRDRLPQVIMLQGPAGIGKTSIAKIAACEIACMTAPAKLEVTKEAVIGQSKSTDCVKVYNMSNLKSQEAVSEVKSDLNIGFSSTGRKVVIMDEAHGMTDEAQDSLLTTFENLPAQVYVIVCSTELDSFRDAFLSRCVLRRLTSLNKTEMQTFLRTRIEQNKLKFQIPMPMLYQLISTYTGREPRRAVNLLDSFEPGSTVSVDELETFFNVYEGKQILQLVRYLYSGDILNGLSFISDMDIGESFKSTILEMLRAAENGQTSLLSSEAVSTLKDLVDRNGLSTLLGFAIDCTTHRLNRNTVSGYFLKWCTKADMLHTEPTKVYAEKIQMQDLRDMSNMIEERPELKVSGVQTAPSLEMLFADGETIEE